MAQSARYAESVTPNAILLAATLAFWPVWIWYVERLSDGSDEPLGIVALITLFVLQIVAGRKPFEQTGAPANSGFPIQPLAIPGQPANQSVNSGTPDSVVSATRNVQDGPPSAFEGEGGTACDTKGSKTLKIKHSSNETKANSFPHNRRVSNSTEDNAAKLHSSPGESEDEATNPVPCVEPWSSAYRRVYFVSIVLLVSYCATVLTAPNAVQALLAALALATICNGLAVVCTLRPGDWFLIGLSLPLVATANFYCGYPLRCVITFLSCEIIQALGLEIKASGTELISPTGMVEVDAPCSGIKMLWLCSYLAATFASLMRLRTVPSIVLMVVAVVAAIAGNVLRVSALFFLETNLRSYPSLTKLEEPLHQVIGLLAFLLSAGIMAGVAQRLKKPSLLTAPTEVHGRKKIAIPAYHTYSMLTLCLIAGVIPFCHHPATAPADTQVFHWPATFEGRTLTLMSLSGRQQAFLSGFPGQVRLFTDGDRKIIWRIVTKESRQVHPSTDCYRGMGFKIDLKPIVMQANGLRWYRFIATRDHEQLEVRETIQDQDGGHHWTDVSSWYWDAFLGRTKGPWQVISVISKAPPAAEQL